MRACHTEVFTHAAEMRHVLHTGLIGLKCDSRLPALAVQGED